MAVLSVYLLALLITYSKDNVHASHCSFKQKVALAPWSLKRRLLLPCSSMGVSVGKTEVCCEDLQKKDCAVAEARTCSVGGCHADLCLQTSRPSCRKLLWTGLVQRGAAGLTALCCSRQDASLQLPQVSACISCCGASVWPGHRAEHSCTCQQCPCAARCVLRVQQTQPIARCSVSGHFSPRLGVDWTPKDVQWSSGPSETHQLYP